MVMFHSYVSLREGTRVPNMQGIITIHDGKYSQPISQPVQRTIEAFEHWIHCLQLVYNIQLHAKTAKTSKPKLLQFSQPKIL